MKVADSVTDSEASPSPGPLGERHAVCVSLVRSDDVGKLVVLQEIIDGCGSEAERGKWGGAGGTG